MSTVTAPEPTTRRVLLRLLVETPNETVTHSDVCAVLGREVSRQAVSNAARRLGRDVAIDSRAGAVGGYRLLLPVPGGEHACANCARYGTYGFCKRLQRVTRPKQWCGGWRT
jgi:hypothetical protein